MREFWIQKGTPDFIFDSEKESKETLDNMTFRKDCELIKVREVSPVLDATYLEMEKALEDSKKIITRLNSLQVNNEEDYIYITLGKVNEALAKLKEARKE